MRSEQEMFELIVDTARGDERIRAVILNGSRANPNAPRDIFQDYDVVYVVTEIEVFKGDPDWIKRFGEMMILQLPDDMGEGPETDDGSYGYLMQFADGNRIDLTLYPLERLKEMERDSLSVLLLDKDGCIEPFPPPNEGDYLPRPPAAKEFSDCCNEFWWVSTYVAKGLWREEIIYAKYLMEQVVREELLKMLTWYIGMKTQFLINPGKFGKYFKQYLEPELWRMLLESYTDSSYDRTWDALDTMGELFRGTAVLVAAHFDFDYPYGDDERVTAHLKHVRLLPRDAREMY